MGDEEERGNISRGGDRPVFSFAGVNEWDDRFFSITWNANGIDGSI